MNSLYFHIKTGDRYELVDQDEAKATLVNVKTGKRRSVRRQALTRAFRPYDNRSGFILAQRELYVTLRHCPLLGNLGLIVRETIDGLNVRFDGEESHPWKLREDLLQAAEALKALPTQGSLEDAAACFGISPVEDA
jgi:hypothetical protein